MYEILTFLTLFKSFILKELFLFYKLYIDSRHLPLADLGGGGVPGAHPLWDPILLFLHTFSLKSARVGGPRPPPPREILDPPLLTSDRSRIDMVFTAQNIFAVQNPTNINIIINLFPFRIKKLNTHLLRLEICRLVIQKGLRFLLPCTKAGYETFTFM